MIAHFGSLARAISSVSKAGNPSQEAHLELFYQFFKLKLFKLFILEQLDISRHIIGFSIS